MSIECTVCSLPQSVRSDIAGMRAKAVPYREMSRLLSERGYLVGTSKDSIARCLRDHGTARGGLPSAEGAAENLVAAVVAEVLGERWGSLCVQVAERLRELGLDEAAAVVASSLPDYARAALAAVGPDEIARRQLEARALIRANKRVISAHPALATELAKELAAAGFADLAEAYREVAARHLPSEMKENSHAEV